MSDDFWNPGGDREDGHGMFPSRPEYNVQSPPWRPPIDIYETETHVVLIAELPGVHKDDIKVCFNNSVLTVSGVKRKVTGTKGCSYFCVERYYGAFKRSFKVISEIDKHRMDATFDAGILTIILPKTAVKKEVNGE